MPGTRRSRPILLVLLVATAAGVASVPLTLTLPAVVPDGDSAFHTEMLPRLIALNESTNDVESLVRERSRNVLALQAESTRIERLVEEIDAYLISPEYHGEYPEVVDHYRKGSEAVLTAISGAREALATFDFSRIPSLIPLFTQGSENLELALTMLESAEPPRSS